MLRKYFNMKKTLFILFVFATTMVVAQKKSKNGLNLKNCVVVGQLDNADDRYALEINLTDMLNAYRVNSSPSLNHLKLGADAMALASDSLSQKLATEGFDTYLLVSVRGYDRRFKVSDYQPPFREALEATSLFDLYREDIVSVSIEFKFFRNGEFVYGDILKCGNISDREQVILRMRNKLEKRISKKWL